MNEKIKEIIKQNFSNYQLVEHNDKLYLCLNNKKIGFFLIQEDKNIGHFYGSLGDYPTHEGGSFSLNQPDAKLIEKIRDLIDTFAQK